MLYLDQRSVMSTMTVMSATVATVSAFVLIFSFATAKTALPSRKVAGDILDIAQFIQARPYVFQIVNINAYGTAPLQIEDSLRRGELLGY